MGKSGRWFRKEWLLKEAGDPHQYSADQHCRIIESSGRGGRQPGTPTHDSGPGGARRYLLQSTSGARKRAKLAARRAAARADAAQASDSD